LELFVFLIFTFLFGLAGGLIYLIYLPFRNKLIKNNRLTKHRSKQINTTYICGIVLISAYATFNAVFPGRSFYEDEFKSVTIRDIPKSAKFIEKTASYPDFHGHYFSSSQIRLSKTDYSKLLNELINDKNMTKNGEIIDFEEFDKALDEKDMNKIIYSFTRQNTGRNDYLYIGFYNDLQTVFVNVHVK